MKDPRDKSVNYVKLSYDEEGEGTTLSRMFEIDGDTYSIPRKLIRSEDARSIVVPDWIVNDRGLDQYAEEV